MMDNDDDLLETEEVDEIDNALDDEDNVIHDDDYDNNTFPDVLLDEDEDLIDDDEDDE